MPWVISKSVLRLRSQGGGTLSIFHVTHSRSIIESRFLSGLWNRVPSHMEVGKHNVELFTPGRISQERDAFFVSARAASVPESAIICFLGAKVFTKGTREELVILIKDRFFCSLGYQSLAWSMLINFIKFSGTTFLLCLKCMFYNFLQVSGWLDKGKILDSFLTIWQNIL